MSYGTPWHVFLLNWWEVGYQYAKSKGAIECDCCCCTGVCRV